MNDIYTMRTELANDFAVAGAKLLSFTAAGGALAAIPETVPQQYAVAGTLESIQKVLLAAEPSHPQRRLRRGDRPTEPLSFDEPAEPVIPAPRELTDDQIMDMAEPFHDVGGVQFDEVAFARALIAHIARQAQPTDRDAVDGARWRFMMAVSDDANGPEANALEQFARDEHSDDTRPESVQMAEITDKAIRALKGKSGSEGAAS